MTFLFGHIVVASVLTQSAHDLTDKRRIHVTTSVAQVALRVEKHLVEKFW